MWHYFLQFLEHPLLWMMGALAVAILITLTIWAIWVLK